MDTVRTAIGSRVRRTRRWARHHRRNVERAIEARLPPRVPSACWAPHSALYFRPDGAIQACCATGYEVGWVTGEHRRSLQEIWEGARLQEHRSRLEADRFDLGCQECEVAIEAGGRASSLASHFDRWRREAPFDRPRLLDFALSSRCNLQCVMCNGELSSAIRTQREGRPPMPTVYDDRFFDELADLLPHVDRVQFKGGEPFLARENRRVWDLMIELGVQCEVTVTTNGTIWNDDVERYVRELGMWPNISIDGTTSETYDAIRVGAELDRVWENVDRFQAVAAEIGREVTLSYCLMTNNWWELPSFLEEVDRRGASPYVIFVNQPHPYDVLRLPADELAELLADLERRAPVLPTDRVRREWERVLARLRTQLATPVTLTVEVVEVPEPAPVVITIEHGVPVADALDLVAARTDVAPVSVVVDDHLITAAEAPSWAAWLQVDRWVGHRDTELFALLGDLVGVEPSPTLLDPPRRGITETIVTWPGSAELPELTAWAFSPRDRRSDEPDEPAHERWLLAPRSPA